MLPVSKLVWKYVRRLGYVEEMVIDNAAARLLPVRPQALLRVASLRILRYEGCQLRVICQAELGVALG